MSRRNDADQGQPSLRRPAIVYDQHAIPGHPLFAQGRPWGCTVEKNTGYPVGAIKPRGWRAPWLPPQGPEIFVFDKDNPTRFTINYEHLLAERAKDAEDAEKARIDAAVARGWNPSDPEKQEALDQLTGRRGDMQRPEVIVACMKGDLWILGASDRVNPKVEKFLPKKTTRISKLLDRYDFSIDETEPEPASLADDLEARMDLQEQHDPDDTPRGRVPVKPSKTPRPKSGVAA